MNILEEFWYGNIEPADYDASPSKEYKELSEHPGADQSRQRYRTTEIVRANLKFSCPVRPIRPTSGNSGQTGQAGRLFETSASEKLTPSKPR